jgi:hypothetical protein
MRIHGLNVDNLPHISVIDTRTGAKIINMTVRILFIQ